MSVSNKIIHFYIYFNYLHYDFQFRQCQPTTYILVDRQVNRMTDDQTFSVSAILIAFRHYKINIIPKTYLNKIRFNHGNIVTSAQQQKH